MFSGIVEQVGRVEEVIVHGAAHRLIVNTRFEDLAEGESVAVNGVCLTVVRQHRQGSPEFFVSSETLDRSNLSALARGYEVNLERAVTPATRLSGHMVQGHVDGKARIFAGSPDGQSRRIKLSVNNALHRYCVQKGSITLDGVSLTLNAVAQPGPEGWFAIDLTLIPYTLSHTSLRHCRIGSELNVEVDVIAKYVERLCHVYPTPSNA